MNHKCLYLICSVLLLSGCSVYYDKFYTDPEKCFKVSCNHCYDAVIIPGFPHQKGGWSRTVQERVHWAVYLYKNGIAKNLIFSGAAVYTPYVEARIMAMYAEQLGVSKEHILIEEQAEHSTENLYFSYVMAQKNGLNKIALASHPAQSSFLKSFPKKFKLKDLDFIPIVNDTLIKLELNEPIIEEEKALVPNFVSLVERENVVKRLFGTRGNKVRKIIRKNRKLRS
ncbi:MAG: YdcF family protein [Cytophagaceae bacterium]